MSDPLVSIVVPTYNRETLLPRALDSIVSQTVTDWEIILVDDGSTDGTKALAQRYQQRLGDRFVYIHRANTGCGGARNRGIDATRGRFVAFLDSDDEFMPDKLERQLSLFRLRPELGFVYSDYAYIDLAGRRHESVFATLAKRAREVHTQQIAPGLCICTGNLFDVLLREYFIATIVGMVRREVLGSTIRWSADPSYSAEWLFFLKVVRVCPAGLVDEPLSLHHFVEGSVTRTSKHRNLLRLRSLLLEMNQSFDDLTGPQRTVVRRHLATTCRQLGYNGFRSGASRQAAEHLAESFRWRPSLRALYDIIHVGAHWLRSRGARAGKTAARRGPCQPSA